MLTAYSFSQKFNTRVVLDLIGCDSSSSFSGSWHLHKLLKQESFSSIINVQRRLNIFQRLSLKFLIKLLRYKNVANSSETIEIFEGVKSKNRYFFPHFEDRYFINSLYYDQFLTEVKAFREHNLKNIDLFGGGSLFL